MKRHGLQHEGQCEVVVLEAALFLCSYTSQLGHMTKMLHFNFEINSTTTHKVMLNSNVSSFKASASAGV